MDSEHVKVAALCREILDRVLDEVRTSYAALPTRLKAEAAAARTSYDEAVERLRAEALERDERDRARGLSQTDFRARRRRVDRVEELVADLLDAGYAQACEAWEKAPAGHHVTSLVLEALDALGEADVLVLLPEATLAALPPETVEGWSRAAADRTGHPVALRLGAAPAGAGPGVTVTAPDGHRSYDNTLADRYRRAREGLRVRVAAMLSDEAATRS